MADVAVLVDARPVIHPTAGGRGIGNYTLGLIQGLVSVGADVTALVEHDSDRSRLVGVPSTAIEVLRRDVVRRAPVGAWYIATGMFLHPISFDPIPAVITEGGLPVGAVMYDVIPFRRPDLYLTDDIPSRLARIRRALTRTVDVHLAISAFSAETAIDELGLDRGRMHVIGAGVASRFVPARSRDPGSGTVVAVTGAGVRKNTDGLIRAWSAVDARVRARYRLVVVASAGAASAEGWQSLVDRLGCGGTIELRTDAGDDEVVQLLQQAALVVQPSLEEGFGLTVAEAAACGAPVICSNTSALPEVLDEPLATFDPEDTTAMALAIERGLTDQAHRSTLLAASRRAARRWQWTSVASALVDSISPVAVPRRRSVATTVGVVERPADDGPSTADLIRGVLVGTVTALADRATGSTSTPPAAAGVELPAAGLGRYVKVHELDHLLTVHDGDATAVADRIARRWPTHAWCRRGTVDPAVATTCRSVIVGTSREAAELRGRATLAGPLLVLPEPAGAWTVDDVARSLVWWLEVGHRDGRAVTVVGPASTLS